MANLGLLLPKRTVNLAVLLKYSPDQPRDDKGRWVDSGVKAPPAGTKFYHGGANVPTDQLTTAAYFTEDKIAAAQYAQSRGSYYGQEGKVHEVGLAINNPASARDVMNAANTVMPGYAGNPNDAMSRYNAWSVIKPNSPHAPAIIAELRRRGFDSAHFYADVTPGGRIIRGGSWVVFDKRQIIPRAHR